MSKLWLPSYSASPNKALRITLSVDFPLLALTWLALDTTILVLTSTFHKTVSEGAQFSLDEHRNVGDCGILIYQLNCDEKLDR